MSSIAVNTFTQQTVGKVPPSGSGQFLGYNPRRVGLVLSSTTAATWWPTAQGNGLLGGWSSGAGAPVFLNVNYHGPLVTGEWYVLGTASDPLVVLEVLLEVGTLTDVAADIPPERLREQIAAMSRGKCYKVVNGRWQELINGAFPRPGNGAEPG